MIRVSCDGTVADTFMQLDTLVEMEPERFVQMLGNTFAERAEKEKYNHSSHTEREAFIERWTLLRLNTTEKNNRHIESSLQEYAVKEFEKLLANNASKPQVHYANSTAVRLAERHATHCIYCNRGINGIEGSLSAAAGMSMVTNETVYCVIGDLSFFYDQNALWAQGLRGNLRILLLNNGGGAIFKRFEGLKESNARERIVMACHHTTAEGICMENNVGYVGIRRAEQIAGGLEWLMNTESERPLLLEISED
jgi:2-succinyl-5-enolpyruvyl-6-hydroxy-3-cyclohexene-1-carboxylate synthase